MLSLLLSPFSWIYGWIIWLRNRLYDQRWLEVYEVEIPVYAIGNISLGGTGKTPAAEYLLTSLQTKFPDERIAYLSRGYGRQSRGFRYVDPSQDSAEQAGDEALQVASKFPDVTVAVSESRKTGLIRLQAEKKIQRVVLDDAFQHRKVGRSQDIVMIDANRLPQDDRLLPAGRLREPLHSLKRADQLIINKLQDEAQMPDLCTKFNGFGKPISFCKPVFQGIQAFGSDQMESLDQLDNQRVILFAGIGNPTYFEQQVKALGANIIGKRFFRDHHVYSHKDLEGLSQLHHEEAWFLTTEKDYYRLKGRAQFDVWETLPRFYLPISLHWISAEPALF